MLDLTPQEIEDIRYALVYTAKELDQGNSADLILADRLELLDIKLREL